MSDIEFGVRMQDQVSPAAKRAGSSLDELARKMRKQQAEQARLNRQAQRDTAAVARQVQRVERQQASERARMVRERIRVERAAQREQTRIMRQETRARQALQRQRQGRIGAVVGGAANLAVAAGVATVGLGAKTLKDFAQNSFEAAERASRLETMLNRLSGRDTEFLMISQLTRELGLDFERTGESYASLLAMKFSQAESLKFVKLTADLQAVGVAAETTDRILHAVGKISAQGYLQGDELQPLTEAGLAAVDIYQSIADAQGIAVEKVRGMQAKGQLKADMVMPAIQSAMMKRAKETEAGQASAADKDTFSGQMRRLRAGQEAAEMSFGKRFAGGVQKSGGIGFADLARRTDQGGAGSNYIQAMGDAAERLGVIFNNIGPPITELFMSLKVGIMEGLGIKELADGSDGFGTVLERLVPVAKDLGVLIGRITMVAGVMAGVVVFSAVSIATGVRVLGEAVGDAVFWIVDKFSHLDDLLFDAGKAIIDGLGRGMSAAWEGIKSLMPAKLKELLGVTQKSQEIHSPSRLWARELGEPMGDGVGVGLDRSLSKIDPGASIPMPRVSGGAKGGAIGGVNVGGITIHVTGGNSREVAQSVMQELETNLALVFSRSFAGVGA